MKRHWSARLLSASLALWFGLAMLGPQAHQCPVHDAAIAATAAHGANHASHDDDPKGHQHCSCPQACCPVGVGVALPVAAVEGMAAPAPVAYVVPTWHHVVLPRAPRFLLPFALAPPHARA